MSKTEARCPLCGAKITATHLLDHCHEVLDLEHGVLSSRCPHCQGRIEVRPRDGELEIGYTFGNRFQVASTLLLEGLRVESVDTDAGLFRVSAPGRQWEMRE